MSSSLRPEIWRYISFEIPWWESECSIWSHSSRARASTSASGTSIVAPRHGGVEHGLAELGLDALLLALGEPLADVVAQLVERVEAGLGGELVVELGQLLGLDLLDRDGELGLLAGQLLGAVVVGERDLDRALLAGDRARELLLEARDEPARAELDHLVAALAAGEGDAVERAQVVHHHEVALGGGALDRLQPAGALAQALDLGGRRPRRRRRARACRPRGPCTRRASPWGGRRSRSRTSAARPGRAARPCRAAARRPARSRRRRWRPSTRRRSSRARPRRARRRGRRA